MNPTITRLENQGRPETQNTQKIKKQDLIEIKIHTHTHTQPQNIGVFQ